MFGYRLSLRFSRTIGIFAGFFCSGLRLLALRGFGGVMVSRAAFANESESQPVCHQKPTSTEGNVTCSRRGLSLGGRRETLGAGEKGKQGRAGVQSGTGL